MRLEGLVPDGVARVVRRDAKGDQTVDVRDNFFRLRYTVRPPEPEAGATLIWHDADGRTVKTVQGP